MSIPAPDPRPAGSDAPGPGVPAEQLEEATLLSELEQLHATRSTTLRHGSDDALDNHTRRTRELENEYLRRNPGREVDPARCRH